MIEHEVNNILEQVLNNKTSKANTQVTITAIKYFSIFLARSNQLKKVEIMNIFFAFGYIKLNHRSIEKLSTLSISFNYKQVLKSKKFDIDEEKLNIIYNLPNLDFNMEAQNYYNELLKLFGNDSIGDIIIDNI